MIKLGSFFLFRIFSPNVLFVTIRSSHRRCSIKKGLEISQKLSGKHLCQILFLSKVARLRPATLLQKELWHRCFPINFAKF